VSSLEQCTFNQEDELDLLNLTATSGSVDTLRSPFIPHGRFQSLGAVGMRSERETLDGHIVPGQRELQLAVQQHGRAIDAPAGSWRRAPGASPDVLARFVATPHRSQCEILPNTIVLP
jgi:hypothetical protein